ncbi:MAG TPA: hypothetical protein VGD56_20535 [Gemmatirosa sp.]
MHHSEHDPGAGVPIPERLVEELDHMLAERAHPDDTPVDEQARRARAVEWAVRAERRRRFAAEHGETHGESSAASPQPAP